MPLLPPIPPWYAMHPLIVHFPIALLLTAPLLFFVSLFASAQRVALAWAALLLMALGTAAGFVAVYAGEAAFDHLSPTRDMVEAISAHEKLAQTATYYFAGLTLAYFMTLLLLRLKVIPNSRLSWSLIGVVFLAAYVPGALQLANAAHRGGVLVHNLGIHVPLPADTAEVP